MILNNFITKYFKEPYINALCVELAIEIKDYKSNRQKNITFGIIAGAVLIFLGIVLKSLIVLLLSIATIYYGFRREYLKVKAIEKRTKSQIRKVYPIFVQTLISLLYTNDNLIKVFILLQSYHFDPYIDRAIVIMINKYQLNPENAELIFAEFCNIFTTSSASLLHQLLMNINDYGVNDEEIHLLEKKIEQDTNEYFSEQTRIERNMMSMYGNGAVALLVGLCLAVLVSSI